MLPSRYATRQLRKAKFSGQFNFVLTSFQMHFTQRRSFHAHGRALQAPVAPNLLTIAGSGVSTEIELTLEALKPEAQRRPVKVISKAKYPWWVYDISHHLHMGQPLVDIRCPFGLPQYYDQERLLVGKEKDFALVKDFSLYLIELRLFYERRLNIVRQYEDVTNVTIDGEGFFQLETADEQRQSYRHVILATGAGCPRTIPEQLVLGKPNPNLPYPQLVSGVHSLSHKKFPLSGIKVVAVMGSGSTAAWATEQYKMEGFKVIWLAHPAGNKPSMIAGGRRNETESIISDYENIITDKVVAVQFDETSDMITVVTKNKHGEMTQHHVSQIVTALGADPYSKLGPLGIIDSEAMGERDVHLKPKFDDKGILGSEASNPPVLGYEAITANSSTLTVTGAAAHAMHTIRKRIAASDASSEFGAEGILPRVLGVGPGIINTMLCSAARNEAVMFNEHYINFNVANKLDIQNFLTTNTNLSLMVINEMATQIIHMRRMDFPDTPMEYIGLGLSASDIKNIMTSVCENHGVMLPVGIAQLAKGFGVGAQSRLGFFSSKEAATMGYVAATEDEDLPNPVMP